MSCSSLYMPHANFQIYCLQNNGPLNMDYLYFDTHCIQFTFKIGHKLAMNSNMDSPTNAYKIKAQVNKKPKLGMKQELHSETG